MRNLTYLTITTILTMSYPDQELSADALSSSTGLYEIAITSPASFPANFTLNPGGTFPGHSFFPSTDNYGAGSVTGMGSANCTPAGCQNMGPGPNIEYQLNTVLSCSSTSSTDSSFGGVEDTFALIGADNDTGGSVTLGMRFTSSWTVSATRTDPIEETADASIGLNWAVAPGFCIELTSCPDGTLVGGTPSTCPAGSLRNTTLVIDGQSIDASMPIQMVSSGPSNCDATVTVLPSAQGGGGDFSMTSFCSTENCTRQLLSNDTVSDSRIEEACQVAIGPNYQVSSVGDLTVRTRNRISINEITVAAGGVLKFRVDPSFEP